MQLRIVVVIDIDDNDFVKEDGHITDETYKLNRDNVERVVTPIIIEEYGSPYVKIVVV